MTQPAHAIGGDARDFLVWWFSRVPEDSYVEIRPLNKRTGQRPLMQTWTRSVDDAIRFMTASMANGDDLYIGAQPRTRREGTADAVGALTFMYADIDYGTEGHARPARYATRDAALAAIKAFPIQPSAIVDTGGGFHAWWALAEAVERTLWFDVFSRVAVAIGGDANVGDAPRILRVPGTLNLKLPDDPRPVTICGFSERVVSIGDFLDLPGAVVEEKPVPAPRTDTPFGRANDVPIVEVFQWLGIKMHNEGPRTYSACPVHGGSNESQMAIGGRSNVATCFGDCNKSYTPVDIVMASRGVRPKEAVALLAERFSFEGFSNVVPFPAAVPEAWESQLSRGKKGVIENTFGNVCKVLRYGYADRLSFDEMALIPCLDARHFNDGDIGRLREDIERRWQFVPGKHDTIDAVRTVSDELSFHPVRLYLDGLEWDGVERLAYVGEDILGIERSDLSIKMLRRWFISAVARAFDPGCKVDTCLVLKGPQGFKKSTFFSVLGGQWFIDTKMDISNKDSYQQLHRAWLYEWGEIDGVLRRRDAADVKAYMTSAVDMFRAPYAAAPAPHKRSGVIVGTTNKAQFIIDETGSRRFWILDVAQVIPIDKLRDWRDWLWAEAVAAYRKGEAWWLDREDDAEREADAEAYAVDEAWEAPIAMYLEGRKDPVHVAMIMTDVLNMKVEHWDASAGVRVGHALARCGWTRGKRVRLPGGMRAVLWYPPSVPASS